MRRFFNGLAGFALLFATALPAPAESLVTSAASQSATTSVGSMSASLQQSSQGSSGAAGVAEGDYRIIEMAALAERPGIVRVALHATDPGAQGQFVLYLPQRAADENHLATGQVVTAHQRPYGIEFARAETQQPFFLVLADEWYRELQSRPVGL